jgi:hypothetical protein
LKSIGFLVDFQANHNDEKNNDITEHTGFKHLI